MDFTTFVEKLLNIKLKEYQKIMINNMITKSEKKDLDSKLKHIDSIIGYNSTSIVFDEFTFIQTKKERGNLYG